MGHNPTGYVLSLERRREVYAVCSRFDVIILEDDPYWYLQYPSADIEEAKLRNRPLPLQVTGNDLPNSSGFPFLDSLAPSFLNIDVEGRVIRLDTFSKTVAPGCRLGWVTAQPLFVEKIVRYVSRPDHSSVKSSLKPHTALGSPKPAPSNPQVSFRVSLPSSSSARRPRPRQPSTSCAPARSRPNLPDGRWTAGCDGSRGCAACTSAA